jgi:hypothetical protein
MGGAYIYREGRKTKMDDCVWWRMKWHWRETHETDSWEEILDSE